MILLALQRVLVLGGLALVSGLAALGAVERSDDASASLPESVEAPDGGWYQAVAAPRRGPARGRTACGYRLTATTDGVGHPVLPCGTRIYVAYGGVEALTQVLARGSAAPRSQFVVTRSLARRLGLASTDLIRWRYARDA